MKLDLRAVNSLSAHAFTATFGGVFEHSPWIAGRALAQRPFASAADIHRAMVDVVRGASVDEQVALLRAHPELAGREAQTDTLTAASTGEQRHAGLTALTMEERARIRALNAAHAERFGFPFIIAARLHDKGQILAEFERRLALSREAELQACLEQVFLITRLRLADLIEA